MKRLEPVSALPALARREPAEMPAPAGPRKQPPQGPTTKTLAPVLETPEIPALAVASGAERRREGGALAGGLSAG